MDDTVRLQHDWTFTQLNNGDVLVTRSGTTPRLLTTMAGHLALKDMLCFDRDGEVVVPAKVRLQVVSDNTSPAHTHTLADI